MSKSSNDRIARLGYTPLYDDEPVVSHSGPTANVVFRSPLHARRSDRLTIPGNSLDSSHRDETTAPDLDQPRGYSTLYKEPTGAGLRGVESKTPMFIFLFDQLSI